MTSDARRQASTGSPQRPPRRPATPGKRESVLDAAVDLFLSEGFDRTSMDAVAARAGVSKTTVYAHFGDKVELFHAVTERGGASLDVDLDEVMHASAQDAEERLALIVFRILEATAAPQYLAFLRVMVAEAVRRPELTRFIQSRGVPHGVELIASTLREDSDRHGYTLPDPEAYAGLFIRMAAAALQMDALLVVDGDRDTAFRQVQATWMASIFLRALRNTAAGQLPDAPDGSSLFPLRLHDGS
jgi:TetR/AcrR family transcriptional repressor of mexJK operon